VWVLCVRVVFINYCPFILETANVDLPSYTWLVRAFYIIAIKTVNMCYIKIHCFDNMQWQLSYLQYHQWHKGNVPHFETFCLAFPLVCGWLSVCITHSGMHFCLDASLWWKLSCFTWINIFVHLSYVLWWTNHMNEVGVLIVRILYRL
jgi:hypothetical protein